MPEKIVAMRTLILLTMLWLGMQPAAAQNPADLLQSGPMVGYAEMREVMLWVQTTRPAIVFFAYWPEGQPDSVHYTDMYETRKEEAWTAHLVADEVEPGRTYEYQLYLNKQPVKLAWPTRFKTPPLWQWRTDPPEFTVATGSCAYINEPPYDRPGKPYGGEYEIFTSIYEQHPDIMLWLGDNTYLREADWFSWTGIVKRYTHTRSLPEMQPLLANASNYAIWDDHEYGPNDADRTFVHKDKTLRAFRLFWGNPSYGLPGACGPNGITTYFQWGDVDFFLLDNRWFRPPNDCKTCEKTILGKEQLEWLIEALAASKATFKLVAVGGQVLNTVERWETWANLAPEERNYLLGRLAAEGVRNLIFLTGDRHHTELSKFVNEQGWTVYDLTSSPLTSRSGPRDEVNKLRVPGTLVTKRNFVTLTFSGPRKQRTCTLRCFDAQGNELWQYVIEAE